MYKKILSGVLWDIATNYSIDLTANYIEFIQKRLEGKGITIDQVKYAANKIIEGKTKSYEKMPTFGEFLEIIEGNKDLIAEGEAQNLITLIRSEGADREPALPEYTKKVLNQRFGGWYNICSTLEDSKIQWFIKEFKEAYLSEIAKDDRLMLPDKEEAGKILKLIKG
jgi:hypothetical protein